MNDPVEVSGLHLLLTYQCNLECDHCFVWGSPWQEGTMTLAQVQHILEEGQALGTVSSIYFEGGEAFLYYATLLKAVRMAVEMNYQVGIVSNGYWATSEADALNWLRPFAGLVHDLSLSEDGYHWHERLAEPVRRARAAAQSLGIPVGTITVAQPEAAPADTAVGQLPEGESAVMHRGRAADKLANQAPQHPWQQFDHCPYENLRDPGRVHVDPLGYVHVCQGVTIGNLFQRPLADLLAAYDPDEHPVTGPLLAQGPAGLVTTYQLPHRSHYADACHLCYESRVSLRSRFPEILAPDQMYGVLN